MAALEAQPALHQQLEALVENHREPDGTIPAHAWPELTQQAVLLAEYPQCTAPAGEGRCTKPDGHSHRCKKVFNTTADLLTSIVRHKAVHVASAAAAAAAAAAAEADGEEIEAHPGAPGGAEPQAQPQGPAQGLPEGVTLANLLAAMHGMEARMEARLAVVEAGRMQAAPAPADPRNAALDQMLGAAAAPQQHMLPAVAGQVTNATASGVAGLNLAATQLAAAAAVMPVATLVPVPLAGHPGSPAAATTTGEELAVPFTPVLPEHFSEHDRYSNNRREATMQLVTDPITGLTSMRMTQPASAGVVSSSGSGRALKSGQALAQCLSSFPAYCLADQMVETALRDAGCAVANYNTFRQAMLRLAKRAELADAEDWQAFLLLDRTLRLIQHQHRLPWDHAAGQIDSHEVTAFVSIVAARSVSRRPPPRAPRTGQPQQAQPFRPGAPRNTSAHADQPDRQRDCFQFWHGGPTGCRHGTSCKFAASHKCRTCGSSTHGTAQHGAN